jgi:hypothetical protein
MPRQIYLPDFDRHAEPEWGRHSSLQHQLVYSALTYDRVVISAASPFKNRRGWKIIDYYKDLLQGGLLKFPLDRRHDGRVSRYIANRIRVISPVLHDGSANPEYLAYTDAEAQCILTQTDLAHYTTERIADCDAVFRNLVLDDIAAGETTSLAHLLDGFRNIRGDVQDAQFLLRSRALDHGTHFQRFDLVSCMPPAIRKNDAYRMKVEKCLDTLFFQANANAVAQGSIVSGFEGSLAQALHSFSASYRPGRQSLDELIMALPPEALFRLKFSDHFQEFLGELQRWLTDEESWTMVARDIARHRAFSDIFLLSWGRTLLLSVFAASLSWSGGSIIAAITPLSPGLAGWLASTIVGCLPVVTKSLHGSSAADVYISKVLRPKINASLDRVAAIEDKDSAIQQPNRTRLR